MSVGLAPPTLEMRCTSSAGGTNERNSIVRQAAGSINPLIRLSCSRGWLSQNLNPATEAIDAVDTGLVVATSEPPGAVDRGIMIVHQTVPITIPKIIAAANRPDPNAGGTAAPCPVGKYSPCGPYGEGRRALREFDSELGPSSTS